RRGGRDSGGPRQLLRFNAGQQGSRAPSRPRAAGAREQPCLRRGRRLPRRLSDSRNLPFFLLEKSLDVVLAYSPHTRSLKILRQKHGSCCTFVAYRGTMHGGGATTYIGGSTWRSYPTGRSSATSRLNRSPTRPRAPG